MKLLYTFGRVNGIKVEVKVGDSWTTDAYLLEDADEVDWYDPIAIDRRYQSTNCFWNTCNVFQQGTKQRETLLGYVEGDTIS